jgi:2-polyprenyl-3-methyl-5-hydroxy-6-metoxy-1,4-benzoquinol methylase
VSGAEHWDAVYGAKAEDAVSWYQRDAAHSVGMLDACGVTPQASVLDVGGGASVLVDSLLARGHSDVTVLDVSEQGLARARARLGDESLAVHWVVADVTRWSPERTFDVWHDRAVFHFLTDPEDRNHYAARMREALPPGGLAVVATFAADGPDQCSGLPVQRYDAAALRVALGADLDVVAEQRLVHRTPWGAEQPFTWLALRRSWTAPPAEPSRPPGRSG